MGRHAGHRSAGRAFRSPRSSVAAASTARCEVEQLTREVLALYTCGPAGGGGVRTNITPRLASDSCFVPREWLQPRWRFTE